MSPRELGIENAKLGLDGLRRCGNCLEIKTFDEFQKDAAKSFGLKTKCRRCSFLLNKAYFSTEHGKKIVSEQTKRKWIRVRHKVSCRNALNQAIASGIVAKGVCQTCGSPDVEAHHDDYNFPLAVRWLCRKHHNSIHGKLIND